MFTQKPNEPPGEEVSLGRRSSRQGTGVLAALVGLRWCRDSREAMRLFVSKLSVGHDWRRQ